MQNSCNINIIMKTKKLILYHGTSSKNLKSILKNGLLPRGKKKSNWKGFGESRHDLVYLTNCYAPYYAYSACKKNEKAVVLKLEIDPKTIQLFPDEEFIFNFSDYKKLAEQNKKDTQKFWKMINPKEFETVVLKNSKQRQNGWEKSLEYLGTVTAEKIPVECIKGYYVEQHKLEFVMNCDPVIGPLNYKFCGQTYKDYLNSLNYVKIT